MNFRDYRHDMGWTLAEAASFLGIKDGSLIAKHETGRCLPSLDYLQRYERLTKGAVTHSDFAAARRAYLASKAREKAA